MPNLTQLIPNANMLIALQPEELGPVVLELIHSGGHTQFQMPVLTLPLEFADQEQWPRQRRAEIDIAMTEALMWLSRVGLIMPTYGANAQPGLWMLTRRGKEIRTDEEAIAYREAMLLPTGLIHPEILPRVNAAFLRGDNDVAVFSAFKALEVAVRKAGGYEAGELGVPLVRKAFHSEVGTLTDKKALIAEREALSALFAGAIGFAKNPTSHRDVEMNKTEAAQLILFASYLMSIVDARTPR